MPSPSLVSPFVSTHTSVVPHGARDSKCVQPGVWTVCRDKEGGGGWHSSRLTTATIAAATAAASLCHDSSSTLPATYAAVTLPHIVVANCQLLCSQLKRRQSHLARSRGGGQVTIQHSPGAFGLQHLAYRELYASRAFFVAIKGALTLTLLTDSFISETPPPLPPPPPLPQPPPPVCLAVQLGNPL